MQKKPDEKECMEIFMQMLKGFSAIHEKGFLHRDLKPDNILINDKVFKIADFGVFFFLFFNIFYYIYKIKVCYFNRNRENTLWN